VPQEECESRSVCLSLKLIFLWRPQFQCSSRAGASDGFKQALAEGALYTKSGGGHNVRPATCLFHLHSPAPLWQTQRAVTEMLPDLATEWAPGDTGMDQNSGKGLDLCPSGSQAIREQGSNSASECKKQLHSVCFPPEAPVFSHLALLWPSVREADWMVPSSTDELSMHV
jgi:hypothetical protein